MQKCKKYIVCKVIKYNLKITNITQSRSLKENEKVCPNSVEQEVNE